MVTLAKNLIHLIMGYVFSDTRRYAADVRRAAMRKETKTINRTVRCAFYAAILTLGAVAITVEPAAADEGGISFWLPGIYGSLAATPMQPGLSFASVYYHTSVSAGGNVAAAREVTIGGLNPTVNVNLNANLDANVDLVLLNPTYVFSTPVFGGQLAIGLMGIVGHNKTSIDGTLTAMEGPIVATHSGSIDSSLTGFGDLYPQASLRWNMGVHNFMTYVTGDIPVGAYNPSRLANLGIGHGAIDGGVGYTYFNPATRHEFSAVTGLTYNFKNNDTNYQNGVDWHLDWGASQFLSKQFFVGAVGYFYNQITADSGQAVFLGSNESRVIGVGPQIGFLFPVGNMQGYLNVKGYGEFDAASRPSGWNAWLTFAISPAEERASTTTKNLMIHK
jgi:hypothetical protein